MLNHQYSLALIQHEANGAIVDQRATDGYINATSMCAAAGKRIAKYLENQGTTDFLEELAKAPDVRIRTSDLVQIIKGGPPQHQGTWVHPQVAIHLAQWLSPVFAVKVSKWVYDWGTGKANHAPKAELPYHIKRHMQNLHKVPPSHFSILQEMTITLLGPLEVHGYTLPENLVPDISQGRMFCDFLRKHGLIDPKVLPTYRHSFPDGRTVDAKLYPIELLADFRKFVAQVWMPQRAEAYFRERDPAALPHLDKVLRLEAPSANHANLKRIA
jgi:hypothetical protein